MECLWALCRNFLNYLKNTFGINRVLIIIYEWLEKYNLSKYFTLEIFFLTNYFECLHINISVIIKHAIPVIIF